MKRTEIVVIPEYYKRYVNLVPDHLDLIGGLEMYGAKFVDQHIEKYRALADKSYAEGKWNLKQIFVHLNDSERIFSYRTLRFARSDDNALPGFEQDDYASKALTDHRTMDEIIEEFKAIRASTLHLYKSLNSTELKRFGTASGMEMSVLSLGFVITGHLIHHQNVIEEKYYGLL